MISCTVETGADDFEDRVQHFLEPRRLQPFCNGNKAELRQGKTNVGRKFGTHPLQERCLLYAWVGHYYCISDEGLRARLLVRADARASSLA